MGGQTFNLPTEVFIKSHSAVLDLLHVHKWSDSRQRSKAKLIGAFFKSLVAVLPNLLVVAGNQSLVAQALTSDYNDKTVHVLYRV